MRKSRRQRVEGRGKIELTKSVVTQMHKKYTQEFESAMDNWNDDKDHLYIAPRRFSKAMLEDLVLIAKKDNLRLLSTQAQAHLDLVNLKGKPVSSLPLSETAIIAWVKKGIIQGWIFCPDQERDNKSSLIKPYLITDVKYHPPEQSKDYRIPAKVVMSLINWEKGKDRRHSLVFHQSDLSGTVSEIMADKGIFHETKELVKNYFEDEKTFIKWRSMLGEQFLGNGEFQVPDGWREHDYELKGTRLVVDDRCDEITERIGSSIFEPDSDDDDDETVAAVMDLPQQGSCNRVPLGMYIWMFNLDSHRGGFVHMTHLKPYVYRPELKEKLILPESHEDLIDALTSDMDVLMEDIVKGKSGGTAIICQGKAGTGKTLTAEIFSEVMKRPLYRVHSGQLGIDAPGVEEALKEALNNAKRWRAVLLIDEADIFLMQRGTDLSLNAVVGVFLRVLEYYDGVLFLTTNRTDAIDDAILSRCIAKITFEPPDEDQRLKLWRTLGEIYSFPLIKDPKVLRRLAKEFVVCGRDIKNLIRLVTKYSRQRKKKITIEDVKRLANFRGL